jgi:uncharacterized protein YbgA (DUF1722 family)
LAARYPAAFLAALRAPAPRRRHVNALQHAQGHFSDRLDARERAECGCVIDDYARGLVPLIVPVTLLRHFVRRFDVAYLAGQSYLEPSPKELMLRNHA